VHCPLPRFRDDATQCSDFSLFLQSVRHTVKTRFNLLDVFQIVAKFFQYDLPRLTNANYITVSYLFVRVYYYIIFKLES